VISMLKCILHVLIKFWVRLSWDLRVRQMVRTSCLPLRVKVFCGILSRGSHMFCRAQEWWILIVCVLSLDCSVIVLCWNWFELCKIVPTLDIFSS
jgi:hypothetical protein